VWRIFYFHMPEGFCFPAFFCFSFHVVIHMKIKYPTHLKIAM
jgi:hypothetical protein